MKLRDWWIGFVGLVMVLDVVAAELPLAVNLLINNSSDTFDGRGDVDLDVLKLLQLHTADSLQITPVRLSNARAWKVLKEQPNYCALSKIKNRERSQFLWFSALPSSIFPPMQLLSYQRSTTSEVQLERLLQLDPALKIGIVAGRSYGAVLDPIIAKYPQNFFARSGEATTQTLLMMLYNHRLDGIIEFAATARSHARYFAQQRFYRQNLQGLPAISGYIVCNQSPAGRIIMQRFDKAMATVAYQNAVIVLHQAYFEPDDFQAIEAELQQRFPLAHWQASQQLPLQGDAEQP